MANFSFRRCFLHACALTVLWCCTALWANNSQAFILSDLAFEPWLGTASGSRPGNGRPVTLTWSLVADGTATPNIGGGNVGSNLISFLDGQFGGNPAGGNANDLTQRPWFDTLESAFDRWEELGGIDYVYEPNDNGSNLGAASGVLSVRGDIRLGGRNVDGAGDTLAFNFLPNNGDMVIDTSEGSFFGNSSNSFLAFRNTVMHELGHGLALEHVESSTDDLLLEPSINLSFDGPQLDEVRAVHFYYGDINEKSNNGLGNDVFSRATDLGSLAEGSLLAVGSDADVPTQRISATATDFVSISNLADTDYYSFTIAETGLLDATLTPHGGDFTQAGEGGFPTAFDADARSDLTLAIFDRDGITPLMTVNNGGLGESDTLEDLNLLEPGEYFARVTGAADTIQLYELELSLAPVSFEEADFNEDTSVDGTDLTILQASFGNNNLGDTDGDGDTDGADFLLWQRQFDGSVAAFGTQTVPEPTGAALLLTGLATILVRCPKTLFMRM